MKEFTTAVRVAEVDEDVLEWKMVEAIDDDPKNDRIVVCRAYPPTDGQWAMALAGLGRHTSDATRLAAIIDFFVGVLDEPSHQYLVERLLDRRDPFGLPEVSELLEWMVEEWGGRPTGSPSGSATSRRTGGQKSTRTTSRSTSSASRRTGT